MLLEDSVRGLKGVGPKKAEYLANLGIRTVRDLLYHFPRSFADRSRVMPLMHCPDGEKATVRVVVEAIRGTSGYQHRSPMKLSVSDETGKGEVVFFNAAYLKNTFAVGESYCFYGPIQRRGRTITLQHPEFCSREEWDRFSKLTPVYPLSAGLTQNDIRALVGEALKRIRLSETLPDLVVSDLNLVPLETAMTTMHWPENLARWHEARRRFAFEELFSVQLAMLMIRKGC